MATKSRPKNGNALMLKELFDFLSPETSITDFGAFVNDFIPLNQRLSIFLLKSKTP